jgi:4-hydroxythreonine-4-phosphate dehydrogenase
MPTKSIARIAITPGEPAGIGPDLCIALAQTAHAVQLVALADPQLLEQRAQLLGLPLQIELFDAERSPQAQAVGSLCVLPVELLDSCRPGILNVKNSLYVLQCLQQAVRGCLDNTFSALVTGPVHKGIINEAGIEFSGHTEYLAQLSAQNLSLQKNCGTNRPVMMLQTKGLRVALVTTHLPLRQVADAITPETLREVLEIVHADLREKMGIADPIIYVCGLNPHAGEGGHLGWEEQQVIEPVLHILRDRGLNIQGPFPADTIFTPDKIRQCDVILSMYHDQGLPVLKHLGFGNAVNVTLGLPVIRTSVDHGTALELAGTGKAHVSSLEKALQLAIEMAHAKS